MEHKHNTYLLRREAAAEDGWHGRPFAALCGDKNGTTLRNAYRQGQLAMRSGRACGCAECDTTAEYVP